MLYPKRQVRHGDLFLDAIVDAIDALVMIARKMQHGFAKRLAGNRSRVDAHASDDIAPLDNSYTFAHLRALNGGALSGRTRTDHDQIIILHCDQSSAYERGAMLQFAYAGSVLRKAGIIW